MESIDFYIYGAVILYLPVNLYAGHFDNITGFGIFRMLLFDGTFYHLWYLPALAVGMLIVIWLSGRLPFRAVAGICGILYFFGLLGDSYYGLVEKIPIARAVYDAIFHVSSYTRNGIFYVPIFLVMGAWFGNERERGIYLLHPMVIILVRGMAKAASLESILIEESFVHYQVVCLLSVAASCVVCCFFRRQGKT